MTALTPAEENRVSAKRQADQSANDIFTAINAALAAHLDPHGKKPPVFKHSAQAKLSEQLEKVFLSRDRASGTTLLALADAVWPDRGDATFAEVLQRAETQRLVWETAHLKDSSLDQIT